MRPSQIHKDYTVHSAEDPASQDVIGQFRRVFGEEFDEYLALCEHATNIVLTHTNGANLCIWGPSEAIDMNKGYAISRYLPNAVPIADDGNCRVLFYWDGNFGKGLYLCDMGTLITEEVCFVAKNLEALLRNSLGVDKLLTSS